MTTILWFRQDLRLTDNSALDAAISRGGPIVPLFIFDHAEEHEWSLGGASRWWLHHSLKRLSDEIKERGNELIIKSGDARSVMGEVLRETGATSIFWNRCYEPRSIIRDTKLKQALVNEGIDVCSFNSSLLREPWEVATQKGDPYKVFTPFWRASRALGEPARPSSAPDSIPASDWAIKKCNLITLKLLPDDIDWAHGLRERWNPGEKGALIRLNEFREANAHGYADMRNIPSLAGTSRLSPHLHFGELGPRQVWHAITSNAHIETDGIMSKGVETFLSEIGWREFSYHLLYYFPELPSAPLRKEFERFPWADSLSSKAAWECGKTGYPIVDAGMRELWSTGWMHNRVRMIVASFLVKDLLIDWRCGARWFWDTLVDADLASNSASWQWVAGCGADAAPYFRIFNPTTQAKRFDPDGSYVRQWIPEISGLPNKLIHTPWLAKPIELSDAGISMGSSYPNPIVDHSEARNHALDSYKFLKST